jgi:hypothetical protein
VSSKNQLGTLASPAVVKPEVTADGERLLLDLGLFIDLGLLLDLGLFIDLRRTLRLALDLL